MSKNKKKIRIILIVLIISLSGGICFAAGPEIGIWEIQSVGVPEPVYLEFHENGYISSPDFAVQQRIPYDPQSRTFIFPELGLVRYTVERDKMEVFFAEIGEEHPFIRSFVAAFDTGSQNEVEERFIAEFQAAMIEIFTTTPFMVGYRAAPEG